MKPKKFKTGDILYYVNPFVYNIEKVLIEFIEEPDCRDNIYYIDHSGAYLAEWDLFISLNNAKIHAKNLLDKFYKEHSKMIEISNPELEIEQDD